MTPESQAFYTDWLQQHSTEPPDDLQVLDQLCDLDQRLYAWVAPAFSRLGAPAREVIRGLRALLLLFLKNLRSENALVHRELKDNLLYRWFVRLDQDETLTDAFRIRLVRLRQRLARRLSPEQWQAFLAETVELARRCYPPQPAVASAAPAVPPSPGQPKPPAPSQPEAVAVARSPAAEAGAASASPSAAGAVAAPPIDLGRVNFDLTPVAGRARILRPRDDPEQQQRLPVSAGDPEAYWISKKRPRQTEVTLGYEVGFFSDAVAGLVSGVVVRARGEDNKTQFNAWVDRYQQAWQVPAGQLEVSADREFWTGPILAQAEAQHQTLWVPSVGATSPKGQLDQRYFTYFPGQDLWVCHEGVELHRCGRNNRGQRTEYRAPAKACAQCPTAAVCKGGKGPRKVTRSDFAEQFERARQREHSEGFRAARRARSVFGEGSFAHSNTLHGLDRARYVGYAQMQLQAYWTAAVMNWKKACRWSQQRRAA